MVSSSFGLLDALDELFPRRHARFGAGQAEQLQDDRVEPLVLQHQRHFVDRGDVAGRDDRFFVDVAEQPDLLLQVAGQRRSVRQSRISG